ncbi:hypothetical protein HPB47_007021 [Ixodes persulcatus]|uniref:Uncharacterized protein n=1 Tax=Ixodes persulcatus TaxID=34615 RepID=A0AC60P8S4_IXOPE|nr:hypothetical protein HPB47_007021 [Ixodes persulcatus]
MRQCTRPPSRAAQEANGGGAPARGRCLAGFDNNGWLAVLVKKAFIEGSRGFTPPRALLEKEQVGEIHWDNWQEVSLLLGFSLSLFLLYLLMPVVMRLSSATAANLSILSADFYSLLIGVYVFHYKFHWLYLVSFGLVIAGVALYSAKPTPLGLRRSQDSDPALSFATGTVNSSQYGPLPVMASDGTGPLLSVSHAVSVHTFGTESSPKPNGAPVCAS